MIYPLEARYSLSAGRPYATHLRLKSSGLQNRGREPRQAYANLE